MIDWLVIVVLSIILYGLLIPVATLLLPLYWICMQAILLSSQDEERKEEIKAAWEQVKKEYSEILKGE